MAIRITDTILVVCPNCGTKFQIADDQDFSLTQKNSIECPNADCGIEFFAIIAIEFFDISAIMSNREKIVSDLELERDINDENAEDPEIAPTTDDTEV